MRASEIGDVIHTNGIIEKVKQRNGYRYCAEGQRFVWFGIPAESVSIVRYTTVYDRYRTKILFHINQISVM